MKEFLVKAVHYNMTKSIFLRKCIRIKIKVFLTDVHKIPSLSEIRPIPPNFDGPG